MSPPGTWMLNGYLLKITSVATNLSNQDQRSGLLNEALRNEAFFPCSLYNNVMLTKENF